MKIEVTWDDEIQSIIRWHFLDEWSWDDVEDARQRSVILRQDMPHKVAVILDLSHSKQNLPNAPMKKLAKGLRESSEGRDITVFITRSKLIHNMIEIFNTLPSGKKYAVRSALTLNDAYHLIMTFRMQQ